jgi:hypothetical protein
MPPGTKKPQVSGLILQFRGLHACRDSNPKLLIRGRRPGVENRWRGPQVATRRHQILRVLQKTREGQVVAWATIVSSGIGSFESARRSRGDVLA